MCVIIYLPPNKRIPFAYLQNAVWNNPHGFGLIITKKDNLEVIKEFNEKGTDPERVQKLLDENIQYHRHLHLRWRTEGELTEDNVQPFKVFDAKDREIWFMHNGTLIDYKPGTTNGVKDTRSDSKIFADRILFPFLKKIKGEYTDAITNVMLQNIWGRSSRGILISSYDSDLYLNPADWKTLKFKNEDEEEDSFIASNDSYFEKLTRGFEFDRRKAEEEAKKKKEDNKNTQGNFFRNLSNIKRQDWGFTKLKDVDFSANRDISEEVANFFEDVDLWTDEGMASLVNMTPAEIEMMVDNSPSIATGIFLYLTSAFGTKCIEVDELKEKNKKAGNMVAELKQRLKSGGLE